MIIANVRDVAGEIELRVAAAGAPDDDTVTLWVEPRYEKLAVVELTSAAALELAGGLVRAAGRVDARAVVTIDAGDDAATIDRKVADAVAPMRVLLDELRAGRRIGGGR